MSAKVDRAVYRYLLVSALVGAACFHCRAWVSAQYWVVEAEYPVADLSGAKVLCKWRFVKQSSSVRDGKTWERVKVFQDVKNPLYEAEFEVSQQGSEIRNVRVWERFGGSWKERGAALEAPSRIYLSLSSPVPLDFASPAAHSLRVATGVQDERYVQYIGEMEVQRVFKTTVSLGGSVHFSGGMSVRAAGVSTTLRMEEAARGGAVYEWVWEDGFPWWTSCETPHYSAILVEVGR